MHESVPETEQSVSGALLSIVLRLRQYRFRKPETVCRQRKAFAYSFFIFLYTVLLRKSYYHQYVP